MCRFGITALPLRNYQRRQRITQHIQRAVEFNLVRTL